MPLPPRVIVTRPAAQAAQWVDGLSAQGLHAQSFPLIEIADALQPAQRAAWQARLGPQAEFDACMWVSANAVSHFYMKNKGLSHTGIAQAATESVATLAPPSMTKSGYMRHWATGPGTVAALLQHGVPEESIDAPDAQAAQWDTEALWQRVAAQVRPGSRVLIVRGVDVGTPSASRDWLAQQVRAAGGVVEFAAVYQRSAPSFSPAQHAWAAQAASDGSVWVFSSSQALAHLPKLPAGGDGYRLARCVATHERIAAAAREQGFAVVCTSRPALDEVARSIKSLL